MQSKTTQSERDRNVVVINVITGNVGKLEYSSYQMPSWMLFLCKEEVMHMCGRGTYGRAQRTITELPAIVNKRVTQTSKYLELV